MKTERGDWHRRNRRGGSLSVVSGAGVRCKCVFCGKSFWTLQGAADHERVYHRKQLRRTLQSLLHGVPLATITTEIGRWRDTKTAARERLYALMNASNKGQQP